MGYLTLRSCSEIVHQAVDMRSGTRIVKEHVVGSSPGAPRWRRQLYRIAFSPLMVAEEEGRRLKDKGAGLAREAGDYGRSYLPD